MRGKRGSDDLGGAIIWLALIGKGEPLIFDAVVLAFDDLHDKMLCGGLQQDFKVPTEELVIMEINQWRQLVGGSGGKFIAG